MVPVNGEAKQMVATIFDSLTLSPCMHLKQGLGSLDIAISGACADRVIVNGEDDKQYGYLLYILRPG